MPYTNYHPVFLDLNGRHVLIVGGGAVAVEKLQSLLPCSGAKITVVSPDVREEIQRWQGEGLLTWLSREFQPEDIEPAYMVIAATDDPDLNSRVYRCGNEKNRLSNSVDDPENCNFIMSAITRRGPMQVAVSSAGCSPALAQRLRNRIAGEILTENVGELGEFLGERRPVVKANLPGYKIRQAFWERVIDSEVPDFLTEGETAKADDLFRAMLAAAVASAPGTSPVERGKVFIVGAGPGDPELVTLKAIRALQRADIVLYDRLVNLEILDFAPFRAERIYVGKEVGHPGRGRQQSINDLMIAHARNGRTVVRLKGGDPFVFGRGGEEILALQSAAIRFEVIPGISSALAGPAAAAIPVTHRGVSTAFAVFAGHEAEGRDDVPWEVAAKIPTAIFLMGVDRLPQIVGRLVAEGRGPTTPVAIVSRATCPDQSVVTATLSTIVALAVGIASPAVIVVGEVVSLRETLAKVANASDLEFSVPFLANNQRSLSLAQCA